MPESQKPKKKYAGNRITITSKEYNKLLQQLVEFKLQVIHDVQLVAAALQDLNQRLIALEPKKEVKNESSVDPGNPAGAEPVGAAVRSPEAAG